MNRLVLVFVLLPALTLAALGALFFIAPHQMAGFAANSVDLQLVEPWRVGLTLLLCSVPLLLVTLYAARGTLRGVRQAQPRL